MLFRSISYLLPAGSWSEVSASRLSYPRVGSFSPCPDLARHSQRLHRAPSAALELPVRLPRRPAHGYQLSLELADSLTVSSSSNDQQSPLQDLSSNCAHLSRGTHASQVFLIGFCRGSKESALTCHMFQLELHLKYANTVLGDVSYGTGWYSSSCAVDLPGYVGYQRPRTPE